MAEIRVRGSGIQCSQVGIGLFVHVRYSDARPHKQVNDGRLRVTHKPRGTVQCLLAVGSE